MNLLEQSGKPKYLQRVKANDSEFRLMNAHTKNQQPEKEAQEPQKKQYIVEEVIEQAAYKPKHLLQ